MKNKPIRHKETNTFKFKRFSDRIAEIDVDVFHRVVHRNEENDDDESLETNFAKTLQKWNVLNLTQGFTAFKKEVRHVITLPQLINQKDLVIESLKQCLKTKDASFMQPILDLVVAVAKDLQKDFYEYFPEFLTIIIDLLATKDPDILDPAFTALAYLFKFLWRYLVRYINTTFELLLPLLVDSKPEYVNNFAAESFAFVARKVRDRESFLQLVFDTLQSTPDGTSGCGKLLFEVIAGTQGQFHSCAEQMLNHYLKIFVNDSIDDKLAFDVLRQIFICITEQINFKHCQILWTVVYNILDEYSVTEYTEKNLRIMMPLIRLIQLIIKHKDGRMLLQPTSLISKVIKIIKIYEDNDNILRETIDLSALILLADNVQLSQETSYELISNLIQIKCRQLLIYTIEKLINHSSFETLVLPMAMQKSVLKNEFDSDELCLFAKIVTVRAPPCLNGENLKNWRRINLNIRAFPPHCLNYLVKILQKGCDNIGTSSSVVDEIIKTLIILPHINPQSPELLISLKSFFQLWYTKLMTSENEKYSLNEMEKISLIFLLATEAEIIHNSNDNILEESVKNNEIFFGELMTKFSHIAYIMNAIDLFITHMSSLSIDLYINTMTFDNINASLAVKLTSPDCRVRMAMCHINSLFKDLDEIFIEKNSEGLWNALEVMFKAEKVEISVYNYRDRLIQLRALSYESRAITNFKQNYRHIPLRFLLGNFYINFSLLWDPLAQIISTYANENCPEFWPIFRNELEMNKHQVINKESRQELFNCSVVNEWINSLKGNDKLDYVNYQILLWKCMSEFPEYCEARNRDLTVIFIDFVQNYYFKSNTETANSFSIAKKNESNITITEFNDDENEDDEDGEEKKDTIDEKKEKEKTSKKFKLKKLGNSSHYKLLLAQLTVFSKMQNPKMLYREPDMNKIYMDLLTSKSVELQKLALDCIFTYKHKHLIPYKDHIYGLIDEKNLRNELSRFRVADEQETSGMVQVEHREALMPILMRLVYAKMITRGTGRSGGPTGAVARRKIILRFLMGVKEEEMMLFVKMAFKPFERFGISLSPSDEMKDLSVLTTRIITELDLSNIIPPKRLKSAVNLLAIIMEEFGAKMSSNLLPRLLSILICILAQVRGILDHADEVLSGFLPTIKELRTTCIGIIARFFGHFENYNWTPAELDALFDIGVFPWLEKLPIEGIHSPTTLLKLFSAWCQNPRYFCLLVKYKDDDKNMTCLPYIMKLLLGSKTHPSVVNTILEMIEKLLTLQDYSVETEEQMEIDDCNTPRIPLQPRNILEVNSQAVLPGYNLNYGSAILLPHVPDILLYIKRKLEKSKIGVNRTETAILARISELNLNSTTSDTLLSLSVPILVKRAMKGECEETILELLTTIVNLMKNVDNPYVHSRSILPLLYNISSLAARKLLLQLLKTIALKTPENALISRDIQIKNVELLMLLNAMDQRWIDQPDFEKRLDAFTEIKNMITTTNNEINSNLTLEFGVAVFYNCYYFLKYENDLSLKDSAGYCLNILGPKLAQIYRENAEDRKYLIEDTILNLVRNGIRGKNDTIRMRSISLLGVMSMQCPEVHPVLRDLNSLTDKNDPEVDFFENLQHLQLHRRARALLKFCSTSKTLTKTPNSKTLTQFIFPVAASYLCNESFVNKNSIVDAAIETVGVVCRLLPWHQYSIILKHYLDKLRTSTEFKRQIVRIVVAILDAFHYDLSKLPNMDKDLVGMVDQVSTVSSQTTVNTEKKVDNDTEIDEEKDDNEDVLDVALAKANDDNKNLNENEESKLNTLDEKNHETIPLQLIMEKRIVLSPYAAKRVVFDIIHTHLPQLHRSILSRTHHEMSHKVNRKRTGSEKEEEELMRVPIALAVVKLLQKLPEDILNKNLPGIFMKLCSFLKSRLDSVRRATREILQKIMITLGPNYLHHLLHEMNSLLTKGFQIHVLAYTIHAVLIALKPYLKPNHMSENLQSILEVCNVDLFGTSAEEKEVIGITKSVSEAKSTKSFDIFHVLGQFINESCLLDLIEPLNNILNDARSHKTVRKVIECLRHIALGLADNIFIENEKLIIFLYGVVSKSIPNLNYNKKTDMGEIKSDKNVVEKSDCYIIPPEPKSRMGIKTISKTAGNTNDHVMLEFGLKLFHVLLKREKVSGNAYHSYLDPFVSILANCLNSQHVKLSTLALQCLNWVLKMNLESVHSNIAEICTSIFKILHKYGSAGLGKGDNFDLVMAAFKTMSVIVRDVKHFKMSRDQMKALILYAEQDLHDSERQATAFNLIRAIIGRKIQIPEIHGIMNKVSALSVTSESDNVRQQCRVVFYHFLMDYPLGKRLEKHLSFYLSQLSYELQTGRLSALEMIYSIVTGFPENVLIENSGLLYVMVGARLVNDEDPICRKLAAKCINEIVSRVPHNQRVKLFDIVLTWLKDTNVMHRRLAAQLCGIFVTIERDMFEPRLESLLPLILKQFQAIDSEEMVENEAGRFVKRIKKRKQIKKVEIKDPERAKDHHAFQVLQLTLKISANCSVFLKSEKYIDSVQLLGEYSQSLLGHPHLWVRLAATQQIGFILATIDEDKLTNILQNCELNNQNDSDSQISGYIYKNPIATLRSLSLDLLAQLQPNMEFEELADQVVKNLVFIARVIKSLKCHNRNVKEDNDDEEDTNLQNEISILWLLKRLRKCVNVEVTQSPKSIAVRTAAFKWTAGIIATINIELFLKPILFQIMSLLVREMMTTEESNAPLRQLSKEVGKMIKKRIGDEEYTRLLAKVQQRLDIKRAERKKTQTQQFIIDPELAAKRKIARQQKKKEAKKRKISQSRGKKMTNSKKSKGNIDLDIA